MADEKKKEKKLNKENEPIQESTTESGENAGAESETVTIPLKDYAAQLEELDDMRQKVDEFSDGWQRERAEFANYRKRVDRDREMERQNSKIDVIKKYLAVNDDFERALKNIPQESVQAAWLEGLKLIEQKLKNLLDGEGIAPIPAENKAFDPVLHEAISHEENPDFESGQIIEVVQKGYTIGDRVIRPALVRVAK
ncbi:nucleotide exchange factor GrpE [Pelolinea submarina]|uniref:Protein GrpE n=1 Tax=Pelolinea submarina TaxID=913107 RepID=A0A347ZNH4_9CHLR|nr:nucleotide exchange factor GrpE [Pelolinea submarina]REG08457.1 molecular chaperone GrpE [Pelolinea submarina]BBB46855.1 molecular chaperone GrpE [Pelolinea submarina]